jgi:hypothetical protein
MSETAFERSPSPDDRAWAREQPQIRKSPFFGAALGEFAVGHGLSDAEVERWLPEGTAQREYLGRKFPVTFYPALGVYGANIAELRVTLGDIDPGRAVGTILFSGEQGALVSYNENLGDTTTAEG